MDKPIAPSDVVMMRPELEQRHRCHLRPQQQPWRRATQPIDQRLETMPALTAHPDFDDLGPDHRWNAMRSQGPDNEGRHATEAFLQYQVGGKVECSPIAAGGRRRRTHRGQRLHDCGPVLIRRRRRSP
jgi:hypothetical protein